MNPPKKKGSGGFTFAILAGLVIVFAIGAAEVLKEQGQNIRFGHTAPAAGCLCVVMGLLFAAASISTHKKRGPKK